MSLDYLCEAFHLRSLKNFTPAILQFTRDQMLLSGRDHLLITSLDFRRGLLLDRGLFHFEDAC